ncbi:MAG TPA: hypothetical protein ENJ18_17320 [Nannocystis exedens]|nr:hypothetical protein [Nannocystis exedens]
MGKSTQGFRLRVLRLALCLAVVTLGCAPLSYSRYYAKAKQSTAPLPERAKIFLVAGGLDVANFADEIVEQRRIWRARGFGDDEIICYIARPTKDGFRGDRRQFRAIFAELEGCYAASTAQLREHLRLAAERSPPFIYIYMSSHGTDGLIGDDVELPPNERALLDRYIIQLGEGPGQGMRAEPVLAAYRRGVPLGELLWTPDLFAEVLGRFAAEIPKIIVLQACHSGGFVDEPRGRARALREVPNLTMIASARFDRTSFGCDPGPSQTYFGELFNDLLRPASIGKVPPEIRWRVLFDELKGKIRELEDLHDVRASLPVFFSSE